MKSHNYAESRKIIVGLHIGVFDKISLISKLNKEPDVTRESIKNYESLHCSTHSVTAVIEDKESLIFSVICENEELAKAVTYIRLMRKNKNKKIVCY